MVMTPQPCTEIEAGSVWTLALNRNQNLLGRCMLILNRPCESVAELDADEWVDLGRWIGRVRAALDALFVPDRYNHAFLMNVDAQVHLHVVPRYRGPREWDGGTYDDPHFGGLFGTDQRLLDADALRRLAIAVRTTLPDPA